MLTKILIANRGEIALRIHRTLREMGIPDVAIYSDADRNARYVLEASEAYRIGPPPASDSYLNSDAIISTAIRSGCDAIHPGYGFLAENARFSEAVSKAGITFIGPSPEAMRLMGDKIAARTTAIKHGIPVVPGSEGPVTSPDEARDFVARHGMPVLVKAGGGGGGRGIRVVENDDQLGEALERASREANAYFANPEVYLERYFSHARHIEVQIVGDSEGEAVAWGERDCSTQRRRQKLIEESPAPNLPPSDRSAMLQAAVDIAKAVNYVGVGTVEFLYVQAGQFFFLEMNTRIQVEHTITEQVTGLDLIRQSVEVAMGMPAVTDIQARGHAIEARINAEDPARDFAPGPGLVSLYREPGGPGVRIDSGVYQGFVIPGMYDSLVSKLVVMSPTREQAVERMLRALDDYAIEGIPTTIGLLRNIVDSKAFRAGEMSTTWLDQHLDELVGATQPLPAAESGSAPVRTVDAEINDRRFRVRIYEEQKPGESGRKAFNSRRTAPARPSESDAVVSPMHGTVIEIRKAEGAAVKEGEAIIVVEAMKMENEVAAPRDAKISRILVSVGETIEVGQTLVDLE